MFKKRSVKGNIRQKDKQIDSAIEIIDEDNLKNEICESLIINPIEIRNEQKLRKQKHALEILEKKNSNQNNNSIDNGIENNVMKSNFIAVASDNISAIEIGDHENIMHKFIEKKLGLEAIKNDIIDSKPDIEKEEDNLYRLPENLRYNSTANKLIETSSDGTNDLSANQTTGISEVALPMTFKLKNIEETEKLKRNLDEKRSSKSKSNNEIYVPLASIPGVGHSRFFQYKTIPTPVTNNASGIISGPNLENDSSELINESNKNKEKKPYHQSNDDRLAKKFKNSQRR
jgi:hypothetical protein